MSGAPKLGSFPGAENGFDTIRLIAAFAVIVGHAFPITGQAEPVRLLTGQTTMGGLAVYAFFIVSGFLIPQSLDRGTLARYALKRARRIMPALVVAVLLCALVLGPVMTTLDLSAYFTDPQLFNFLGNAIFLPVQYGLPGVFEAYPSGAVNGSLWSLKYEVACYVLVPVLMAIVPLRKAAVIAVTMASFVVARVLGKDASGVLYLIQQMALLFTFYGAGMLFLLFKDQIPIRASYAWVSLALFVLAGATPFFVEAAAIFGAYSLITFAYLSPQGFRDVTKRGDISYGVYVYAYPVQQLLAPMTMGFAIGGVSAGWLANSLLTMPIVAVLGTLSWLLVEKPAIMYGRGRGVATAAG